MTTAQGDNVKTALVESLNALLADHFTLYLKTKNFHWHVAGPNFRDLHLLFDEQAQQIFAPTDIIAERVRKNGAATLTSIAAIGKVSRIEDQNDSGLSAEQMLRELRDDNNALVTALRETKLAAANAGDNATEGLLDEWTDQAQERAWFLGQTLQ